MRITPSFPAGPACVLGVALVTTLAVASCSSSNQSGGGGDAGEDASEDTFSGFDTGLVIPDSTIGEEVDLEDGSSPANCFIPNGTYVLTQTPASDAGDAGDCPTMTSTVTFPMPAGDGGTQCTYTPDGMTPSCTIDFICTQRGATTTATSQGYIQVYDTSYGGYETVTITDNSVGMQQVSQCAYNLSYVSQ